MNVQDAIRSNVEMANFVLNTYLADLSEEDLLKRPVPEANHTAWQLGHLIVSANETLQFIDPALAPALPTGFEVRYGKDNARGNDPKSFDSKAVYLGLFLKQKEALKQILEGFSEDALDQPGPESMRAYAPTIGVAMMLQGSHLLMHVGQIVVLRRMLGKPVVM